MGKFPEWAYIEMQSSVYRILTKTLHYLRHGFCQRFPPLHQRYGQCCFQTSPRFWMKWQHWHTSRRNLFKKQWTKRKITLAKSFLMYWNTRWATVWQHFPFNTTTTMMDKQRKLVNKSWIKLATFFLLRECTNKEDVQNSKE